MTTPTVKNVRPAAGQITFARAVREGKAAAANAGRANFKLGDIARTVVPAYGENTIAELADRIGMAAGSLYDMRHVAASYEESDRSENSWTVHQVLSREDDRVALVNGKIFTVREARELVKSRKGTEDGPEDGAGDGTEDSAGPDVPETDEEKLARLVKYEAQLAANLVKTRAAITALQAKLAKVAKPAAKVTAKAPAKVTAKAPAKAPAKVTAKVTAKAPAKAPAKVTAKVTAKAPAKVPAAVALKAATLHVGTRGVPEHTTAEPRTDCPTCKKNGIKPMPERTGSARRTSRSTRRAVAA